MNNQKKIISYEALSSCSTKELRLLVDKYLCIGWELYGHLKVISLKDGTPFYTQVVVERQFL